MKIVYLLWLPFDIQEAFDLSDINAWYQDIAFALMDYCFAAAEDPLSFKNRFVIAWIIMIQG